MIKLKNIYVTFCKSTPLEYTLFKDFNLKIKNGDFLTLIGENGSGKSTLMDLISGDLKPDSGSIEIDSENVTHLTTNQRSSLVSRVFQDPMMGSFASLSIEENLALADSRGCFRGLQLALNKDRYEIFYNRLKDLGIGLENRMKDLMGSLSGGQRQAICLIMATLRPSKILLLDEHSAALDPKMAQIVIDLTEEIIAKFKLTAIMITHSMHYALNHGNRTLLLKQGQLLKDLSDDDRKNLTPSDLLNLFETQAIVA